MKNYVVIGCGRFGSSVAKTLYSLGHEVLAIDKNEEKCIIEKSIRKIINKQIDLKNKVRDKDKDAQDIKDLVANYEEELEK